MIISEVKRDDTRPLSAGMEGVFSPANRHGWEGWGRCAGDRSKELEERGCAPLGTNRGGELRAAAAQPRASLAIAPQSAQDPLSFLAHKGGVHARNIWGIAGFGFIFQP